MVAVIPARGGSKGVPGKNLRRVGGVPGRPRRPRRPRADRIAEVYVSTDDPRIGRGSGGRGGVIDRPAELAGDQASSESALLHALGVLDADDRAVDVLVFVQCTSPFIDPADLDAAVDLVLGGAADTVFAGVAKYEFLWRPDGDRVVGVNHDAAHRPRRQDRDPHVRETGGFYAFERPVRRIGHRFFGRTAVVAVPELTRPGDRHRSRAGAGPALAPSLDPRPPPCARWRP